MPVLKTNSDDRLQPHFPSVSFQQSARSTFRFQPACHQLHSKTDWYRSTAALLAHSYTETGTLVASSKGFPHTRYTD
jgi:hypothetical protein